jgi:hypothetical protein
MLLLLCQHALGMLSQRKSRSKPAQHISIQFCDISSEVVLPLDSPFSLVVVGHLHVEHELL